MTVNELAPYLKEHWPTIRAQLLEGIYKPPSPHARRIYHPGP